MKIPGLTFWTIYGVSLSGPFVFVPLLRAFTALDGMDALVAAFGLSLLTGLPAVLYVASREDT